MKYINAEVEQGVASVLNGLNDISTKYFFKFFGLQHNSLWLNPNDSPTREEQISVVIAHSNLKLDSAGTRPNI